MIKDEIYTELLKLSINSHYAKRYIDFIFSRNISNADTYYEKHHILPKAKTQYPHYEKCAWNIIKLTPREHFIAHWMLWKSQGKFMAFAFLCMKRKNKHQPHRTFDITSKVYANLKIMSAQTQATRIISKITRIKMSKAQKAKTIITCPYCKKSSSNSGNMKRWHFKNCKKITGILKHDISKTNNTKAKINPKTQLSIHKTTGIKQQGANNPAFKGYYIFKTQKYTTRKEISDILNTTPKTVGCWCCNQDRLISRKSYNNSTYFKSLGNFDELKYKTYRDIGFSFEPT